MTFLQKADEYIIRFLYKKQLKMDITYLFFLILTSITSFATRNSLWLSFIILGGAIAVAIWTAIEMTSKQEINKHNRAKVRFYYIITLFLYLFMPQSTYIAGIVFMLPLSIFFIDLVETYCGHDSLHWPYLFHLLYGGLLFLAISLIKTFISDNIFYVTHIFLVIYRPIVFTCIIDNIACELVDLRVIFKAKAFRDEIVSCYDELTEVHNRHGILELCNLEKAEAIAMIDLDHFKSVNDTYDHNTGDIVLKEFSNRLKSFGDDNNFICRWGGEEFIIISNSKGDLIDICTHLLIDMRTNPIMFTFRDQQIEYIQTFSCGIADIEKGKQLDELVKQADIQAYQAKQTGRDKIYMSNTVLL